METSITKGIKITVRPKYQPEQSQPDEDKFIFSYEILIENIPVLDMAVGA